MSVIKFPNPTPVATYEYQSDGLLVGKVFAGGTEAAFGWHAVLRLAGAHPSSGTLR